jgi:hypothetical protein
MPQNYLNSFSRFRIIEISVELKGVPNSLIYLGFQSEAKLCFAKPPPSGVE